MKERKASIVLKVIIALIFIVSIGSYYLVAINGEPLNMNNSITGVDMIKIPEGLQEISGYLSLISIVIPNIKIILQESFEFMSKALIGIIAISVVASLLTVLLRKKLGFIASLAGVSINFALAGSIFIKLFNAAITIKDSLEASLGSIMDFVQSYLPGLNVSGSIQVNLKDVIGIGIILWLSAQVLIIILSIIGLVIKSKDVEA